MCEKFAASGEGEKGWQVGGACKWSVCKAYMQL